MLKIQLDESFRIEFYKLRIFIQILIYNIYFINIEKQFLN